MVSFMKVYLVKAILCLWMYNNFYPLFLHFLSDLFEIRYQGSVCSAVKHSRVSRKSAKGRPYFSDGRK